MKHIADPDPHPGPLFEIERDGPDLRKPFFEGPMEEDEPARVVRLSRQIAEVFSIMKDGEPRTLGTLASMTGYPETSISAQLRHLRKERYGSFIVEKQHRGGGLYEYRLVLREDGTPARTR